MSVFQYDDLIHGQHSTYHLCGIAGRGGWGIIYKARDIKTGAEFALKMSREQLYSQGINALYDELNLVQRINHPSIIQYVDYGHHHKRPILVMELIDSPTLSSFVANQGDQLSDQNKIDIVLNLCDAISEIHQAEVIHCDLKPQNIIINPDLSVKIVDFGLAKGLTPTGEVLSIFIGGTPHFMAPEQLFANRFLSYATDVYALAMITIWLFSSESLWEETGYQLFKWRVENPSALPESFHTLSTALQIVLRKALKFEPNERLKDLSRLKRRLLRIRSQSNKIDEIISPFPSLPGLAVPTLADTQFNTTYLFTTENEDTLEAFEVSSESSNLGTTIALVLIETPDQQTDHRLNHLQNGVCEDLIDLLNVSEYLNLIPFSSSKSCIIPKEELSSLDWPKLHEQVRRISTEHQLNRSIEYTFCLSLQLFEDTLQIQIDVLAMSDQLLIVKLEETCVYSNILNQLGGIARDLAQSLKVTLSSPLTKRTAIAESVDLLFAARSKAVETWHTDVSEAIKLYRQSIALSPEDIVITSEAARVEARASFIGNPPRSESLESAIILAERAYSKAPAHPQPLWALGYVRFYEGKRQEALDLLDQALLFGGERAEIQDLIGRILTEEGPIERALEHLEHALKLNPKEISTVLDLSRLYAYLNQWDRVDELMSIQITSDSDYGALAITKARLSLWRKCHNKSPTQRDRKREGLLFSELIDIFQLTRENGRITHALYQSLKSLFDKAPSESRLAALYAQFIVECLAFSFGVHDVQVVEALEQAKQVGVTDKLWLEYCPLLSYG